MNPGSKLSAYYINGQRIELYTPDEAQQLQHTHSPYWAKVWPAAIGLCEFLAANLHLITDKKLVELAAGLGLPSLFAAGYAASVHCSDIEPAAMEMVRRSVLHQQLSNVQCSAASWDQYHPEQIPDVLLLSDVNYEPAVFDDLRRVVLRYLEQQSMVIVSSPQRLMAKPFIEKLLPFCIQQEEVLVTAGDAGTAVSIFVLRS